MFLDFNIKNNQNRDSRSKKNFCDFDVFDMVTNYIENEIENNPQIKKLPIVNFKKFNNPLDYADEEKVHNKLYKIPSDLLEFLKKK